MQQAVQQAAEALARGQVVCFPTETTYGLAVDVTDAEALAQLAQLKGRADTAPFALIAPSLDVARKLSREWPRAAESLARAHWPGPLTLVVPAREDLPAEIVGPSGGVGVRVSSHPWAMALARAHGAAITATSANPSGAQPALSIAQAREYFGDAIAVYLDGGPSEEMSASTVVQVGVDEAITVLRQGALALPTND